MKEMRFNFRATKEESKIIDDYARSINLTRSEYLRKAALNTQIVVNNTDLSGIADLSYEVNKIGNNVNQIVKYIHTHKKVSMKELQIIMDNVELANIMIREFVKKVT